MGIYVNPTNEYFKRTINDYIYVDKTGIIRHLNSLINKRNRYICISRPRRFGKTMVAEMLAAYYSKGSKSEKLFKKLGIYKSKSFQKHLNNYDVVHINIQNFLSKNKNIDNLIYDIQIKIKNELLKIYNIKNNELSKNNNIDEIFDYIYNEDENCNGFIFIIDEWDAIFRDEKIDKEKDQKKYLDFLRLVLKDKIYVKLAYMTGILPIKKYGSHSALNMFEENSMVDIDGYGEYFGFTSSEVKKISQKVKFDIKELKKWYDGYIINNGKTIYNPKSIVEAINKNRIGSYWTRTETFESLKLYVDLDFKGLKTAIIDLLMDKKVEINTNSFQNDMKTFNNRDDVLTLLVHLGYLTYDSVDKTVSIPNYEVRQEFEVAIKNDDRKELVQAIRLSDKLLDATINMDEKTVSNIIDKIHIDYTDIKHYNTEESLSNVIKLAYYTARDKYTVFYELETGKGYADMVFLPKKATKATPAFVVELKYGKSVEVALKQLVDKKYMSKLNLYKDNMLLVGISYDKGSKCHSCKIEKYIGGEL